MTGLLSDTQIELLLECQLVGRIGCHANGVTYIVPISYAYDGKSIFLHTMGGRKVDMMRKNPNVCFQVDHMVNMANWESVIAWGKFEEITDVTDRKLAAAHLMHRRLPTRVSSTVQFSNASPFEDADSIKLPGIVCKITLTKKTGRYENDFYQPAFSY